MTGPMPYRISDLEAQPGSQVRDYCHVSVGPGTVAFPIAITHGTEPGSVLAVTAGIHGGNTSRWWRCASSFAIEPSRMRGTVMVSLQSSPIAFEQRSAFVNPLDGQNLNRSFPGDPRGGPTAPHRLALGEPASAR